MTITDSAGPSEMPLEITANGTYLLDLGGPLGTVGNFTTVYAQGTFGGGTLTFYGTPDGTEANKVVLPDGEIIKDAVVNVLVKSKGLFVELTGATTPAISVWGL